MATTKTSNVFATLNAIDVGNHTETKNGLTYLAWAWAWTEVKKAYPNATYKIYENENGWNYFTDGRSCWVKTGVTIEDIEYIEYLPVMDFKNNSIPIDRVTSFDVNKAIQRSLTKACARHGLGLYIYAGEDLPEAVKEAKKQETKKQVAPTPAEDPLKESFEVVKVEIEKAASVDTLQSIYKDSTALHGYQPFMQAMTRRKKEILNG